MTLTFQRDQWVTWRGREGRVVRTLSIRDVQLLDRNGDAFIAPIAELQTLAKPPSLQRKVRPIDSDTAMRTTAQAQRRLDAIQPLIHLGPQRTLADVERRAREVNCTARTLYRWIKRYESGDFDGLVHRVRSDLGETRVPAEVEQVMRKLIDERYLTPQKPSMISVYQHLVLEVDAMNNSRAPGEPEFSVPTFPTFRRRILEVRERKRLSRRHGENAAKRLDPITGHYPGATHPLAVVQADHTQLDIKLVDSVDRQLLADRPWITLIMDVFSRVVLGFHISLDAPSAYSVGQALSHAILPKDAWLIRHKESVKRVLPDFTDEDLQIDWPCWGKPVKFKTDNGREFWSQALERSCARHNIDLEFRPVLRPEYGSHIERLLGTLAREIHALPGTTFSNVGAKAGYDSEGKAVMTFEALEVWMTAFFLGAYHNKVHSALGVSPLEMWERGLLHGTEEHPPTGLPHRPTAENAERLRMDFLPSFEASIQRDGVRKWNLVYRDLALNPYIRARTPGRSGQTRKFVFHYDPTDISQLYFLDPELDRHFPVRCAQPDFPSISIWELRTATKFGKAQGMKVEDTRGIMSAYRTMIRLAEREAKETKQTRLIRERKVQRERAPKPADGLKKAPATAGLSRLSIFDNLENVKPSDDIDI